MELVDFRVQVIPDGPGTSTPGRDLWVFNLANDDLADVPLVASIEIECPAGHVGFLPGSIYEMRVQSPLIPQPEVESYEVTARFSFKVDAMEEEIEEWKRFKVALTGDDQQLFDRSKLVLWFSDENEFPDGLEETQTYNIEEITRFTRRRMPRFRPREDVPFRFGGSILDQGLVLARGWNDGMFLTRCSPQGRSGLFLRARSSTAIIRGFV